MYERILVPIDGSPTSTRGLDEAIKLARLTGASIMLLHMLDLWGLVEVSEAGMALTPQMIASYKEAGESVLAEALKRVQAAGGRAETRLVDTHKVRLAELVIDEAQRWKADLIVIGTHGRRGMARLMLGSDAEQVLRLATVPVLLVRAPEPAPHAAA